MSGKNLQNDEQRIIYDEEATELTADMIRKLTDRMRKTRDDLPRVIIGTAGDGNDFWIQTEDRIVAYIKKPKEEPKDGNE